MSASTVTTPVQVERVTAVISLTLFVSALALVTGFAKRDEFAMPAASVNPSVETLVARDVASDSVIDPAVDPRGHAKQLRMVQLTERFDQAIAMLHAKQYDFAVTALHRVLELSPNMPEAHVNMGFALLGLKKYKAAGDFFASAIRLNSYQANAYWGLGIALDKLGDREAALGAMRSYIHLAPPGDAYVRKARSAIWEWGEELKRGPLPEAEAQWLAERGQEWIDRNNPQSDIPGADTQERVLIQPTPSTVR